MGNKLSARYQAVINAYFGSANRSKIRAMVETGYSEKYAYARAWEVFAKPEVAAEVERREAELREASMLSAMDVVRKLCEIANTNIDKVLSWENGEIDLKSPDEIPPEYMTAIQAIEQIDTKDGRRFKVRLEPKQQALDMLMRHLGQYKQDNEQQRDNVDGMHMPADVAREILKNLPNGLLSYEDRKALLLGFAGNDASSGTGGGNGNGNGNGNGRNGTH